MDRWKKEFDYLYRFGSKLDQAVHNRFVKRVHEEQSTEHWYLFVFVSLRSLSKSKSKKVIQPISQIQLGAGSTHWFVCLFSKSREVSSTGDLFSIARTSASINGLWCFLSAPAHSEMVKLSCNPWASKVCWWAIIAFSHLGTAPSAVVYSLGEVVW